MMQQSLHMSRSCRMHKRTKWLQDRVGSSDLQECSILFQPNPLKQQLKWFTCCCRSVNCWFALLLSSTTVINHIMIYEYYSVNTHRSWLIMAVLALKSVNDQIHITSLLLRAIKRLEPVLLHLEKTTAAPHLKHKAGCERKTMSWSRVRVCSPILVDI